MTEKLLKGTRYWKLDSSGMVLAMVPGKPGLLRSDGTRITGMKAVGVSRWLASGEDSKDATEEDWLKASAMAR